MDDNIIKGRLYCISGLILGARIWLQDPEKVDFIIRVATGIGSLVALFFAIRYHHYATKEKKAKIKRMQEDEEFPEQ